MKLFTSKKPHFEHLRKKWKARERQASQNLFDKHLRKVAIGSLGGLMLLNTPGMSSSQMNNVAENQVQITGSTNKNILMAKELQSLLPGEARTLSAAEDKAITESIKKNLNVTVVPEIDNKRLNRTYGMIGGEQHLYRYPGDNVFAHAHNAVDWAMFGSSGIAPGLGAWGYFAPSKAVFTPADELRERYYIAVPTFLSPGFSERVAEYRDFYKFRKMLVINPKTGQVVVTDIGDAGPAEWTGKHLGGSPEVMEDLGLAGGPRKGAVLYYFITDSGNNIPLGPLKMPSENVLASN